MAMGKTLKLLGLIGGGVLAFGGGSIGSYLAQPYLEKTFNPQRKEREIKLQQSVDEKNNETIYLGLELNKQDKSNKSNEKEIQDLSKSIDGLNDQISEKQKLVSERDQTIEEKNQQLEDKKQEHQRQTEQINKLEQDLNEKNSEFKTLNEQKEAVQKKLNYVEERLSLKKEDILTSKALKVSPMNIEIRTIEPKGFSGGTATFEAINWKEEKVEFKVKQDNFPDREEKAKYLRDHGIFFELDASFNSWEKTIALNRWDVDYTVKETTTDKNRHFSRNKTVTEFKISDYFDSKYEKEAFKVLVAIGQMDNFPLCLDLNGSSENLFNFCSNMKDSQDYASKGPFKWNAFTGETAEKRKLEIWTNKFKTPEGFIGYWLQKTVEFIRTGTVDLSDLLSPFLLSKNFQPS